MREQREREERRRRVRERQRNETMTKVSIIIILFSVLLRCKAVNSAQKVVTSVAFSPPGEQ